MRTQGNNKSTTKLLNELDKVSNPELFLERNKTELNEETVSSYLGKMLSAYGIQKKEVLSRAEIDGEAYAYQIFDGRRDKPSRDKLIQLAFGFPLTISETALLLEYAGYRALSPRVPREAYILFALQRKMSVSETNDLMEQKGLKGLEWGL
ncbi:MAG: XRE family transcriptional regulator [Lachnospiraceae bacterium]|nr:XRE family transcriptional regulator [Lachnospiraceae bacterium]